MSFVYYTYNLIQINLHKNQMPIKHRVFRKMVRDLLLNVIQIFWTILSYVFLKNRHIQSSDCTKNRHIKENIDLTFSAKIWPNRLRRNAKNNWLISITGERLLYIFGRSYIIFQQVMKYMFYYTINVMWL